MRPTELIEACHESHARLLDSVAKLGDRDVRAPSSLPGWSRAHVMTHLARNADSFVWLCEGAKIGESRHQYPRPGMREADIDAGSSLSASALFDDLARACRALECSFDALADGLWDFEVTVRTGTKRLTEIAFSRLREVEVHHLDLAVGYGPAQWPSVYIEGELARQLAALPERAGHADLVAWLIGRAEAPRLEPW